MEQKQIIIFFFLATAILLIFVIGIVAFLIQYRNRKIEFTSEKKTMEQLYTQQLQEAKLQMQAMTMEDIGRELHDNIAQKLTLASIYSRQHSANSQLQITSIIDDALLEIRTISKVLTNEHSELINLTQQVQKLCVEMTELGICEVHFQSEKAIHLPTKTARFIVRILQEFTQNSLKHSQCKKVNVALQEKGASIELSVSDDGIGFDTTKISSGIGLKNLHQRAILIGATLTIQSHINVGTTLLLTYPKI